MTIWSYSSQDTTGTLSFDNLQLPRIIVAKEAPQQIQECCRLSAQDGPLDPIDFYTCLVIGMRISLGQEERAAKQRAPAFLPGRCCSHSCPPSGRHMVRGRSTTTTRLGAQAGVSMVLLDVAQLTLHVAPLLCFLSL